MDELCPLCLKMGANRKIKAVQVNLEEALWMCENEECLWPFFGSAEPTFIPRKVGEKWAYEWQTYRRVKECVGSIPLSIELSLYTPPVTPSGDASTKDSVQPEIPRNTPEASNTDFISSNLSSRDSYAPTTSAESVFSCHEEVSKAEKLKNAKNALLPYEKDSKIVDTASPSLPSIFDIDGEVSDKISIKLYPDSVSPDQLAVRDSRNSETATNCVDTVLEKLPNSRVEKSGKIKEELVEPTEHSVKGIPLVRSIARTNIDLQRFDPLKSARVEKSELPNKARYPVTTPKRKPPAEIAERLFSPTQHTTTITVEGIPPITLSYDLADLEERIEENVTATSTPICRKQAPLLRKSDERLSPEIPKKKIRASAVRRSTNHGKAFEKFSFSTLRKVAKDLNATEAPTTVKIESPKLEEITNRTESCNYVNDSPIKIETLTSINLDANNSSVTESSPADLSCLLDDMLLDGYQNATQNLNDDWLQSFFIENT